MSLFCRPVWISRNRSAFSECHQEWLSSHRRYCGSNLFQCGSAIIINHETETVYKANGDNVMSSQLIDSFKLVLLSHLFSFIGIHLYLSFDTPQCRGTGIEMMIKTELHVVQMKAHSCLSNSLTVLNTQRKTWLIRIQITFDSKYNSCQFLLLLTSV